MKEQVKRYHKSFVGLMEQCKDGEWVRSKDFEAASQVKEDEANAMRSCSNSLIEKWQDLYNKEVTHNDKIFMQLQQANKVISWYRTFLAGLTVCALIATIVWRFF